MPRHAKKFINALSTLIASDELLRDSIRGLLLDAELGNPPRNTAGLVDHLYRVCAADPDFPAALIACFYARELIALAAELGLGRFTRRRDATEAILSHFGFDATPHSESDDDIEDDMDDDLGDPPTRRLRSENRASFLADLAVQPDHANRTLMPHQQQALAEALEITRTRSAALRTLRS